MSIFGIVTSAPQTLFFLCTVKSNEKQGVPPGDAELIKNGACVYQKAPRFVTGLTKIYDASPIINLELKSNNPSALKAGKIALGILGIVVVRYFPFLLVMTTLAAIGAAALSLEVLSRAKMCHEIDEQCQLANGLSKPEAIGRKNFWEKISNNLQKSMANHKAPLTSAERQAVNALDRERLLAKVQAAFFDELSRSQATPSCADVFTEVLDDENIFQSTHSDNPSFSPLLIRFSDQSGLTSRQISEMTPPELSARLKEHFPH